MKLIPLHAEPRLPRKARPRAAGEPSRAPIWSALSTMLAATVAALSVTALGACGGGGTAADENITASAAPPVTPPMQQARVDFTHESEYGPGDAPGSTTRRATATATDTATATATTGPVSVAPAGDREDRSAAPVDRQAHTRSGRYVSRAAAERNDAETGGRIVWVDAGCCAGLDAELPERITFGMQAVLGEEAPLYVSGSDLRQAARLADRLDAAGLRRVYLVTP